MRKAITDTRKLEEERPRRIMLEDSADTAHSSSTESLGRSVDELGAFTSALTSLPLQPDVEDV